MIRQTFLLLAAVALVGSPLQADPANTAVEQTRQIGGGAPDALPFGNDTTSANREEIPVTAGDSYDDSFGNQQILKEVQVPKYFDVFAGISAFVTNNVALTHRGMLSDSFLVANFGASASHKLTDTLDLNVTVRGGIFRYAKYTTFDLDTLDVGAGLSYRLPGLWNSSVYANYDFSDFFNGHSTEEFFQNHAFTLGIQKAFVINRAQSVSIGAAADFNLSDPKETQRDELSFLIGYHASLTRRLGLDLSYRYGFEDYTKGGRRDGNNAFSLSLEYCVTDWLSILASAYYTLNRSNQEVFSYDALVGGLSLSANIRF